MKATYSGFITDNKNCSGFEFNTDANRIFDFLNQDEIIIKMAEYADQGKPALAGCVLELEQFYGIRLKSKRISRKTGRENILFQHLVTSSTQVKQPCAL